MRDEHHRLAALQPDPLQLQVEAFARHGVERAERFVHEQHRGVVDEASRDGHALLHSSGELPRIAVLEAAQPHQREQPERAGAVVLAAQPLHVDGEQDVVEHGPPGKQHRRLEDDADVPARAGDGDAAQVDFAARGGKQAGQDLQEGRLPAARGADDGDELAFADGEVDPVQGQHGAPRRPVLLAQALHVDHVGGSGHRDSPTCTLSPRGLCPRGPD